jgi:hypothetical protein
MIDFATPDCSDRSLKDMLYAFRNLWMTLPICAALSLSGPPFFLGRRVDFSTSCI